MNPRASLLGTLFAVAAGVLGGCLGPDIVATAGVTMAQVGTTAFIGGELIQAKEVPLEAAGEAARRAIESLKLRAGTQRAGDRSWFLLARELNGREIDIRLEAVSPAITRIKIRVGIWGEQSLSKLIMDEIDDQLSGHDSTSPSATAPSARGSTTCSCASLACIH